MANHRSAATPLVGRRDELDLLLQYAGVTTDARDIVLLGGDAGIGKTRLLRELGLRAREAGHRVMAGHCLDLGDSAPPYQPFGDAFSGLGVDERDRLAERFPALGPLLPRPSAAPGPGVERAELFASVVAALDSLAEEQPVLLVIEDAHWADASTRHLIRYVMAQGFHRSVHVVVSYRSDDLHRKHPLRQPLTEWVRMPGVRRIELEPLADAEVADLVRVRADGTLGPDELHAVVQRAGGNAFYVEELIDAGMADHASSLPETLSDLLLVRLDRLDEPARRLVRAAAVTDGREGFAALAAAAGLSDVELDEALVTAVDHKVLRRSGSDDYAFRHALLGEALRDDLLPGERRRIHGAFLAALAPDAPPATLARHALAAGDRRTAFLATVEAARAAGRVAGHDEAAAHWEQALELLDAAPEGTDEIDLVIDAADALVTSGQLMRALDLLRDRLAQLPADRGRGCHGRLLVAIGNTSYYANLDAEAEQASADAARVVPDEPTALRGEVVALRARVLSSRQLDQEAIAWGERALAIGEQIGSEQVISDAKATLTRLMVRTGDDPDRARATFHELVDSSRVSGHVLGELRGLNQLGFINFNAGELDQAEWAFAEALRRAEETGWGKGPYGFDGRFFGAVVAYMRGHWDRVRELCEPQAGLPALLAANLAAVGLPVAAARGEVEQIERTLAMRSLWRHEEAASAHGSAGLIELYGVAGDLVAARRTYDDVIEVFVRAWDEPDFPGRIKLAALLLGQYAGAVESLERAGQHLLLAQVPALAGDVERVVAATHPFGPEGEAWRRRAHAEIARLRWRCGVDAPDLDELTGAWRSTLEAFRGLDDPYETARSATRLAAVLMTTGAGAEAAALLHEARGDAERLRARPLLAEIELLRPRQDGSEVQLTPREIEVLHQVAAGRSNGEIGKHLFISIKTVSVHVSNILAKLEASGRTEAAAIARRRGLLDG
ncbi:helix-turn-helix transcriptional regulator [Aeromicrobium wangtongii]|uniref:helix-turn-helix transcriptional regulator n=1 Tax=Aeromicrobium wangtongii TaxID=2969247 RepID=UPI0027154FED|nr:helix-turn-helix transcriptional regulator [Aeromicrobium wangtongii]